MSGQASLVISKSLVAINSASSVFARLVNFVVLLWVYQFLLRHLSAEEFAVLPLVNSLMVFGPLFFSFFIGGIARYMVDAYAKGDVEGMRRVTSSLFPVLAGVSCILLPLGVLFAANIEKVFNVSPGMLGDARLMFSLLLFSFTYQTVIVPFTSAYAVSLRYYEKNLLDVIRDLVRAALTVGMLLILGPSVIWVVIAAVIAESLTNTIMLFRSFRIVPELGFEWRLFSWPLAREMTRFGFWTTLDRLGAIMHTHAATLILNLTSTAADVTAYYVGATFFRQIESTIKLAAMPLLPIVTAMNAVADNARLGAAVLRGGRYALWAALILAVPLAIYADIFVRLYMGPGYETAAWILIMFMVTFPFSQPTILLASTAMAKKAVREFFLPAFMFQCLGFVLMLILAYVFELGAVGVTMALMLVTIVSQLSFFWQLCLRLTQRSFKDFASNTLVRGMVPAAIGALAWAAMRITFPPESWGTLITQGIIGASIYLLVLFGQCLDMDERKDMQSLLGRIRS
ncbi:Membrane protein involved in the export of O-antigen and teichoic acid [Roseivivax lentus]|uniref:Membrane protein involved in the export of O-antigen and teichoic acid n=1 Tax=Roseivivax lentus TaxID=633194 RepID=A0A1N7Q212_9RHOB|nr:hypothetical protein [Roseivivax lentus]SIT16933.1 Membrane protein involved in the export of O-antigen and teichoic acid [Roseivivax lentus]